MLHSSNVDFVSLDAMIELIRCWEISTVNVDGIDLKWHNWQFRYCGFDQEFRKRKVNMKYKTLNWWNQIYYCIFLVYENHGWKITLEQKMKQWLHVLYDL